MDESKLLQHRYKILQQMGEGGFGKTFLAEDTHMPSSRRCIIKQLIPVTDNEETYQLVKERFQREAAVLEQLGASHPQIPNLYAYFQEEELFYLVQEYIEGQTLSRFCESNGVMDESTVRQTLSSLLSVLQYLHQQEIVHRDIKPDNIMLRNSNLEPILLDFGAVKETMGTVYSASHRPTHSMVVGTPGFMPSEQAVGRPVYSSDLYALGLVGVYGLTGKTPQEFATDMETGNLLWREDAVGVSSQLAEVLDRAIASHPRDRYASAEEMRLALPSETTNESEKKGEMPKTVISSAPQGSALPKTQISSTPVAEASPSTSTKTQSKSEWQQAVIQGVVLGVSMILVAGGGFLIADAQGIFGETTNSNSSKDKSFSVASPFFQKEDD